MSRIFKYKQMYFKIISFYFLLCFAREQKNSFKAVFFITFQAGFYWTSRRDRCFTRIFRIPEYSPSPFKTGSTS